MRKGTGAKSSGNEAEALFRQAELAEEAGQLTERIPLLLKAARFEHSGAQVDLGNACASGVGVPQSIAKAAYWYKRAYRNGDHTGAFNLAIDKQNAGNIRGAVFWLKRAVAMRSGEAALRLARLYLMQRGGDRRAIALLRMTQEMKPSEISAEDKKEAVQLLYETQK